MQESEPRNGPERFQTAFIFTPGDPFCSRAAARARPPGFAFVFPSAARQCGAPQPLAPGPSGGDTAQRSAPRARSRAASRPPPRRYRGVGPRHVPITQQMRAATAPLTSPRSFQRRAQPVTERSPSTHKRPHGTRATTGAGKALNVRSHPQTAPGGTRRPGLFAACPSGRDADPAASRLPGSGRGQGPPPGRESRARPPRSFRGRAGPGRAPQRRAAPHAPPPRLSGPRGAARSRYLHAAEAHGRLPVRAHARLRPAGDVRTRRAPPAPPPLMGRERAARARRRHLGAGMRAGLPSAFSRRLGSSQTARCSGGAGRIRAAFCGRSCRGGATQPRERGPGMLSGSPGPLAAQSRWKVGFIGLERGQRAEWLRLAGTAACRACSQHPHRCRQR